MSEASKLDEVLEAFVDGKVSFADFREAVEERLAQSPELSGAALQRLDTLRRDRRMSAALHALMASEIERSSGGDITPPFGEDEAEPAPAEPVAEERPETPPTEEKPGPAVKPAPAVRPPLEVGTVLAGRYQLEALLGRGGMNLVYRAADLRRGGDASSAGKVAVKLLASEYTGREARRVLEWEASLLSGMNHPGVVRMLDFDHDGEHPFLVMELLGGERLRSRLVRISPAPLPMDEAMQVVRELTDALAYIHGRGYVHRDVKPANIFITTSGNLRLVDFGLAAAIGGSEDEGGPSLKLGTPLYSSPELLEGGQPDPRDDVYSLGCVVYEMLTGRHPWGGLPADEAAHRKLKLTRPPGLPESRWTVLRRALAFKAADRPADAAVFQSAFFPPARKRRLLPWVAAAVLAGIAIGVGLMIFGPVQQPGQPAVMPPVAAPPAAEAPRVEEPSDPAGLAGEEVPAIEPAPGPDPVPERVEPPMSLEEREPVAAPTEEPAVAPAEPPADAPVPVEEPAPDEAVEPAPTQARPAGPPALALEASRIRIRKSGVALRLELLRLANYEGPLRVMWRTVDQTALDGAHFAGSPEWRYAEAPSGAPSLVIFIPIVNDPIPGPDRTFIVELDDVRGGPRVGVPARAEVTIVDR